jgi:hypothetical protein
MWSGLIGQWPSQKKLQKLVKPLDLQELVNDLSQKIPKLPKDLKQNVD